MPIRPDLRWFYPLDWRELSRTIRFGRAKGCCERCRRPHGQVVQHLGDGRWWDEEIDAWRNGQGRVLRPLPASLLADPAMRTMLVVLATAHLDHDPTNNRASNLAALCQRCHLLHDRPEHRRRRWSTLRRRKASGDLFTGSYPGRI